MEQQGRTVEEVVGRIASARHGVVTRAQLTGAGVSAEESESVYDGERFFEYIAVCTALGIGPRASRLGTSPPYSRAERRRS
jgi:hypothetical protein